MVHSKKNSPEDKKNLRNKNSSLTWKRSKERSINSGLILLLLMFKLMLSGLNSNNLKLMKKGKNSKVKSSRRLKMLELN
jgi:hypothetical protein